MNKIHYEHWSEFCWLFIYIMDLNNAWNMEHFKINKKTYFFCIFLAFPCSPLNSSPSFNSKNLGRPTSFCSSAFLRSISSWRSRRCWCFTSLVHCWSSSELVSDSERLSPLSEPPWKYLTFNFKHNIIKKTNQRSFSVVYFL